MAHSFLSRLIRIFFFFKKGIKVHSSGGIARDTKKIQAKARKDDAQKSLFSLNLRDWLASITRVYFPHVPVTPHSRSRPLMRLRQPT